MTAALLGPVNLTAVASAFVAIGAMFWIYNQARRALSRNTPTAIAPQPLVVQMAKEFTTRGDHEKLEEEVRQAIQAESEERRSSIARVYLKTEKALGEMADKIAATREDVAAVKKQSELQGLRLTEHGIKLDKILERLPRS